MAEQAFSSPVTGNEVPKVNNSVAIGEDLEFQERWWSFERVIWSFFALIILADVLGVFGRGWFAKAELRDPASAMVVDYERVERASTPSIITIHFRPDAVSNGAVQFYVSNSVVKELGNQRVSPEPEHSTLGNDGITYTFAATTGKLDVQFALEPSFPGYRGFTMQIPGKQPVGAHVVVVP